MATIGLRDIYQADVIEDANGNETFGTPKRLAKAISAKLAVTLADGTLYADDGVDEQVSEFASAKLTLEVSDLADEDVADLLGATIDSATGIIYSSKDDQPKYKAIGFRAKKPGGKYRYLWFYKGKFAPPNDEFATKGEKVEFKSPSIEGTFQTLNKNGQWKADKTALPTDSAVAGWFSAVPELGADTTEFEVSSTTPIAGATGVSKSGAFVWTFSKKMLQSTATTENIYLVKSSDGSKVATALVYDDTAKTVTLTPSSALAASTLYLAIATAGVRDLAGNKLTTPAVAFTTGV